MPQIEIEDVYPKRSSYPMVVNFQNAYATEEFRDRECAIFHDKHSDKRTVITELDNILYVGEENAEDLGRTLLLVRNKKTNKVRVIEAGTIDAKPIIKNNLDTSQLLDTSNLELSRKFGSKREKKMVEQRERLKTNVETIKKQVEKATANISQDQIDLASYAEDKTSDDFYLPPIDRNATKLEEVYDINKMLTEDQYQSITWELENKDFLAEMSPWIRSLVTKSPIKHQILALYASCLIKFYATTVKDINVKDYSACTNSLTIHKLIYEGFTTASGSRRLRQNNYKDKAFCYTAVFLLLVSNYKIPLTNFCEEFKIAPSTATLKLRVTGAIINNKDGVKSIVLKYPLNFKPVYKRKSAKF